MFLPACSGASCSSCAVVESSVANPGLRAPKRLLLRRRIKTWRTFSTSGGSSSIRRWWRACPTTPLRPWRHSTGSWPTYQARLAAMDISGWSVAEQIDYHLVRAEMNGLDFDHRVLRPWARIPSFYMMIHPAQSDVPAHEGPVLYGWIDTWTYDYPLSPEDAAELGGSGWVHPGPPGPGQDEPHRKRQGPLDGWDPGMEGQIRDLASFAARVAGTSADLDDSRPGSHPGHGRVPGLAGGGGSSPRPDHPAWGSRTTTGT